MEQSLGHNEDNLTRLSGKRKRRSSSQSEEEEEEDEDHKAEEVQEKQDHGREKQEKKDDLVSQHWNCPACTFLNEASRWFCEMCTTANPSLPSSAARSPISASEWSCAACTMVNPAVMRSCAICGTLNPRPMVPLGLSITRIAESLGNGSVSSCSEDSEEDGSDSEEEETEEADEEKWSCQSCNTQSSGRTCLNCFTQRPKVVGKRDKAESKEKKKQALVNKRKRRKREKKLQKRAKIAYGVSIYELEKMSREPISSRLVDILQSLTHTLAMMDASADNDWTDGSSFLIRNFDGSSSSVTAKNPELLTVLANIFYGQERTHPAEVRLLAVQSINYLMKMDRHMFARSKIVEVVRLYITELLAWKYKTSASALSSGDAKSAQMIVEECLNGLSSMCSTEGFALREMMMQGNFVGYLSFLLKLVNGERESYRDFHPSIVMTALGILQKCCVKLRWSGKCSQQHHSTGNATAKKPAALAQVDRLTLQLATKLIDFLRHVLQHKHVPLHVKAAKCLLLIFHRTPYDCPEVMAKLVTSEVLRKFVAVVVNTNSDESEESRLAMVTLLHYLFDDRPQLVSMFVREKIYTDLFSGILPLLQSSSRALRTNVLKLTSMLTRVVCRKHSLAFANSSRRSSTDGFASGDKAPSAFTGSASRSPQNRRNYERLNSLPDPDVLSTLLLDFIRADSIPAVDVLLKDGADLNAPKLFDDRGNEFDKPLNVAVECASLGMVRLLLKRGADVHQVGIGGTALHVAARTGRCDIAAFLLQCGARVQAKDREKKTVMDVVNLVDKTASEDSLTESVTSPMKKLFEHHLRPDGMQDYDSDVSESDELSGGRGLTWSYASDQDDEYEDDDGDDMDDDDFEDEEGYYMDCDNDDEDDVEGFDEAGQYNEEMSDHSDDNMINAEAQPSKRRPDSTLSESEMKLERFPQNVNGDCSRLISRSHAFSGNDKGSLDVVSECRAFSTTADEVYEFSVAITQCLLAVLHDMDIQNVERSVISTVACVLEMAPSQLICTLREVDVMLILDTVHFLLQGEKLHQPSADAPTCSANDAISRSSLPMVTHRGAPSTAHNLPSFILAARILNAVVRKSAKESSLFHQIERRGIREQIELLNNASACWVSTSHDGNYSRGPCDTIFGRGLNLLNSLWSDVLESGMLHLHKLRNLAKRLKEFSDESRSCEQELILIDLVDLFEQPNSVTTYEFKQSQLLPAVLQYLSPRGELNEPRALALMRAFERCSSALKHLVFRLQSIITQEETFPLISFSTGKGRELYPLTQPLKIAFVRPEDINAGDKQPTGACGRPIVKSVQSSPLTHFQSFERSVFRCMPVIDSDLSLLYCNLVGHSIQKVVEGKWRKFLIVGYDDARSYHLVKPFDGTDDDLAEMVLHDSQCKLTGSVEVYGSVALDLTLFGSPNGVGTGRLANGKKKRKNKRKRKCAIQKLQHDSESSCQVEAKNAGVLKMAKLPEAWYAAILVNDSGEAHKLKGQTRGEVLDQQSTSSIKEVCKLKYKTCEEEIAAQVTHSIKVLADNRIRHNVPADCLRPRKLQPQVGSVVEVDGALGEVTRIYSNHCSSNGTANVLLDVKTDIGTEKSRVKKDRVRFPAHQRTTLTDGEEGDRIEAMSMRRLFPARDSSLAGNIGDRVWVLPPSGSQITGLCVAGTLKSFPSGLTSVRESTIAIVEISFGSTQPPLAVRVNQDRILNFAVDGGILSESGSSRFLAALQIASGRGGSSRLFGSGQTGQNGSTSAIHRAVKRVAKSLQQRRHESGLGSSSTMMDQLRSFISRNSAISNNVPDDVSNVNRVLTTTHGAQSIPPPNEPIGSEMQTDDEASTSAPSSYVYTLQRYLKSQCAKPKTILLQLPKVSLVVGFRKCDATNVTVQDRIVVSSELDLKRVDESTACKNTPGSSLLIQLNSSTQRYKASAGARKAFLEIFNSFSVSGSSLQEKKRRKLSPVGSEGAVQIGVPWDIEKFIAFMVAVRGPAKHGHTESIAKYCVNFSKYADPVTNRRLLKFEGFISFVVHECKDAAKSKQMLKFLRSRGYTEQYLASSASRCRIGDDNKEEKDSFDNDFKTANARISSNKARQPLVFRGFPADQNVLKCVEVLRREHHTRVCRDSSCSDMTSTTTGTSLPPWKLTYELYCDFQVEWMAQSSKTSVSDLVDTKSLESLSAMATKPPTRLLSCGIATLDNDDATEDLRWLDQNIGSHVDNSPHNGSAVPDSVASAVRLLRYLFRFRADVASPDEALWTSPRLYNKLERQMQDVLSMCSGIYPPWCDELVTHCKFFFPRDLRERLFRSTSFGCIRSLHWFRNQLNIDESFDDSRMSSMGVGGGIYNQEISISPVPKERVKVYRENILQSAEAVMKMHAKRKAVLDVVFVGEKGYGTGVTAAFYSTIAHALQVVTENQKNKFWVPGENDEAETVHRVDAVGDIVDEAPVIRHSNGLFPYPHRTPSRKLVDRFRTMGRLAGKALMDERLLPLPLSPQFMKLVIGESFGLEELHDIFLSHGRILYSMYKASKKLVAGMKNVQIDHIDVQEWLSAVGFTFIDPFSQEPLVVGGEDVAVTLNNLTLYVQSVLGLWLDSGIRAQVLAFREGISEVLPLGKLRLLFVPELLSLLCGEDDIEWNVDSLTKNTKVAHGYTKGSQPVQFLFEVLEEMPATERRRFLLHATGCPNLPPGGFQALKPQFEVVRRIVENSNVDHALPFARTCTNTLHLPAYSSKAVLAQQMTFAIANSRGVIDRD